MIFINYIKEKEKSQNNIISDEIDEPTEETIEESIEESIEEQIKQPKEKMLSI